MDMMLPVRQQMELILAHDLPATWLLQFDALISGPFAEYLRRNMAPDHEVGFWFEMNQRHCQAAGVEWRGRPGYPWDHTPSVAFTIGYTPEERVKLADAAMREFKVIWGKTPASIASWNLDGFTINHLSQNYGINAFAVCRDPNRHRWIHHLGGAHRRILSEPQQLLESRCRARKPDFDADFSDAGPRPGLLLRQRVDFAQWSAFGRAGHDGAGLDFGPLAAMGGRFPTNDRPSADATIRLRAGWAREHFSVAATGGGLPDANGSPGQTARGG